MKRYQVYLNPNSVEILDGFEKETKISRSKIIRDVTDRLADQLLSVVPQKTPKKYLLDDLVGSIKIKGKKQTNYAQNVDDIYLKD